MAKLDQKLSGELPKMSYETRKPTQEKDSLAAILQRLGTDLSPEMFELGEKMSGKVDLAKWAAWMQHATARNFHDKVVFAFPSQFRRDYASMNLKDDCERYFAKPVFFVVQQ